LISCVKAGVVICSFGYCEKEEVNGHKPVGQYGNGFKSGSMRIGRDAIVFTKTENTMSVGMLSQTYLERIEAETILVPIITWERNTNILFLQLNPEYREHLSVSLKFIC